MSELIKTAPERIYLCVSDCESSRDESFPDYHGEITWADHQAVSVTVAYVRSDKAIPTELKTKVLELCDIVENYTDIPLTKQIREMMGEA